MSFFKAMESVEGEAFWALSNGVVGKSYEVDLLDQENADIDYSFEQYRQFLGSLGPGITLRMVYSSELGDGSEGSCFHSRSAEINELCYFDNRLQFHFEKHLGLAQKLKSFFGKREIHLERLAAELNSGFNLSYLKSCGVSARCLSRLGEFIELMPNPLFHKWTRLSDSGIDFGSKKYAVIKMIRPSATELGGDTFCWLKEAIPRPYKIVVSLKKAAGDQSEKLLRLRSKQSEQAHDAIGAQKYIDNQKALEDIVLRGANLFHYEIHIVLPRVSERDIRNDCEETIQALRALGDFYWETFGCFRAFMACLPGQPQHVSLLEKDENLPYFLPIMTAGCPSKSRVTSASLAFHRPDCSLDFFSPFDASYDNHSVCIFGLSGRGKSVLANALTRSLLHDDNVSIIKVDVGGSHSKETELLGGIEYELNLNKASGLNPFHLVSKVAESRQSAQILTNFLQVLVLEEGEKRLSKEIKTEIERCVLGYFASHGLKPSLKDFYQKSLNMPRRDLLERWITGIYSNIFSDGDGNKQGSACRLRYYNFKNIFQAQEPDFAQAGFAAVMAQFNLEMLENPEKRLVFIADETPFFIEKCFSFFKLSIANVRKLGHSFITISQKSSDVVIDNDHAILTNSATKFLFSLDGDQESFQKRLLLSDFQIEKIESLKRSPGVYAESLLVSPSHTKTVRLWLTEEEYFRYSSSSEDLRKLEQIRNICPNLSLKEALKCLEIGNPLLG